MVSTYTVAKNIEKPGSGDYVGTWDVPANANYDVIDASLGQTATVTVGAANIVLTSAQYRPARLILSSTLVANISVTFPTSFTGPYTVLNNCTGSSQFNITLTTTAAGGQVICCPPFESFDCWNDGTNLKYRNMGRVGEYLFLGGSSVPTWISGCTVPPYLNCDGTGFSSGTYPGLQLRLGSLTLPDLRGRSFFALNQGTGRITSSGGFGIDGETISAAGGSQRILQANLPNYSLTATLGNLGVGTVGVFNAQTGAGGGTNVAQTDGSVPAVTVTSAGSSLPFLPPGAAGGLIMIRAA